MKKKSLTLLFLICLFFSTAVSYAFTLKRVSVHDPSVVWEPTLKTYYVFGSHRGAASSTDMMRWTEFTANWKTSSSSNATNAAAFKTQQVKTIKIGGQEVDFPNFSAYDWSAAIPKDGNGNAWNINGNMWAPDVIYNPSLKKWCMYLSINGLKWNSSIILLTADRIAGPYQYQAPVVVSGFNVTSSLGTNKSYKEMDLEMAIGTQSSLPSRYNVNNAWGSRWPHAIDPCVFYDEEGKLWMVYGSWSGGIWILELDEETGLRDYNVKYPITGSGDAVTSDPYFGKRIADGFYSSGEGSYIEYIGGYYFLFISNGGLAAGGNVDDYNNGGYQMRVFRSEKPDGPYEDSYGNKALYSKYMLNFGPNSTNYGVNIFGAYGDWGKMTNGERSQGHNSIIAAPDGRTYLVYHTRFQNGISGNLEAHQMRVHQVFQNQNGWLVAAPFEYTGEEVKSEDIANTQQVALSQIPGIYKLLIHRYGLDHRKKELVTPIEITLKADGTISGGRTGKWEAVTGTSYINLTIGGILYQGVMVEQTMEASTTATTSIGTKTFAFTALTKSGGTIWGYRSGDDPTGIGDAPRITDDERMDSEKWFDLMGRTTTPTHHGVFIKQGKKIIK